MKIIDVFGGALSPPHVGHASGAEAVIRMGGADEFWFMPSADRHDKTIGVSAEHRVIMLDLMAGEIFEHSRIPVGVSRLEVDRPGHTLTFDTMKELEARWPEHQFRFVVSSELLPAMTTTWVKGRELFNEGRFVVIERIGTKLDHALIPPHSIVIDRSYAWIDVSSSFIRGLIKQGFSGMPYLTPAVASYVRENDLYQEQ